MSKQKNEIERRVAHVKLEFRDNGDGERPTIRGHAAVFNELSEDLGGFREKISPGAFTSALKRGDDVRALFNHDPNIILGRAKAKTLRLEEDKIGLAVEIDPPTAAAGLIESMQRGDIDQMSFGFRTISDAWEKSDDGPDIRTLEDVELFDVSVVTYPAYPQTDAAIRSHDQWQAEREMAEESEHNAAPEPEVSVDLMKMRVAPEAHCVPAPESDLD